MRPNLRFITSLFLLLGVAPYSISYCQDSDPYALKAPIDTVLLGEYNAVRFNYVDSLGRITSITNDLIVYKNGREVLSFPVVASAFERLCQFDSTCENCYCCDINADGKKDFLISYFTGGANCCFGAYLYSIADSLELVFEIESNLRSYSLIDLDSDHVPEFVYFDNIFAHWKDCYRCYLPPLIWRWDGGKYRLANFRYADYILKDYDLSDLPCGDSWEALIMLYYAGKSEIADSLFQVCWPLQSPEKEIEYKAFQKQLRYGDFWMQLQESDW